MIKFVCVNKPRLKAVAFVLLTAILCSQCTKIDTTTIGSGLIPGVDNIHTFDTTLNIIAHNYDAINACDSLGPADLLASGIISNNPLFGTARGEMYFELKPQSYPVTLPAHDTLTMVVDSVVLVLKYNHSYGDTNVMQKVQVYQLSEKMKSDSAYQTCKRMDHDLDVLGEATFTPTSLRDSVHGFGEDDANQLRIHLPESFGTDFLNNVSKFKSDSAFKEYFKGFAVVPDDATGGQALNYFNLASASSRLSIYVTSRRDTTRDTTSINLRFTSLASQANYIEKDRDASEVTQHLGEIAEGDSLVFIQAMPGGTYAKLNIPSLTGFPNSVINRAELIVEQVYDPAAANFAAPRMLYLDIPDSSGKYIPIPCDFSTSQLQSGFTYLGGKAKKVTDNQGHQVARYTFNLSRYIQSIVTRKEENTVMRLRAPFYIENMTTYVDRCGQGIGLFSYPMNNPADGGVKLNGSNGDSTRIRLHVIYSKL